MLHNPTATNGSGKRISASSRSGTSAMRCSGSHWRAPPRLFFSSWVFVPRRQQMNAHADQVGARTRKQVWLLVGVFFAPLLLAFLLYYGVGLRPSGSTNHGDLITPPVTL